MNDKKKKTIHRIGFTLAMIATLVIILVLILINTASCQRSIKSVASDFGGGLDRTVTVYDYNGDPIESWTGKFDISESEQEVFFDIDGKRVVIHGGIVVTEEN